MNPPMKSGGCPGQLAHMAFLCFLSWTFPVFSGRVPPCYFPPTISGFCRPLGPHPATELSLQSHLGMGPHYRQQVRQGLVPGTHPPERGEAYKASCLMVGAVWGRVGGAASSIPFLVVGTKGLVQLPTFSHGHIGQQPWAESGGTRPF